MSLRSCICSLVDVHTGVPEARLVVGRTYESLELCGRLATYAQTDELATPWFDALDKRLAEPDARGAREAQRCRAAPRPSPCPCCSSSRSRRQAS